MRTSDESASAAAETYPADVKYQYMTVKAIRGREAATKTKWQNQGWEFVEQTPGTLRSDLTFRKVQPKGIGARLLEGYAVFRRLEPKTQKVALGAAAGLVGLLVITGGIAAATGGDEDAPVVSSAAEGTPEEAGSEATSEDTADEPSDEPSSEPTEDAAVPESPKAEPYTYEGPQYEVVIVDKVPAAGGLNQYWVFTKPGFDFSSAAYKDKVKLIFGDIAHKQGTAEFLAEVVTNKQIAQAEAISTSLAFSDEHGFDYAINTIPKLEVKGWVASYTGGFDYDTGKKSDNAFEVIWRPYATSEIEDWQPDVSGSPQTEPEAEAEGSASPTTKPKPKPKPAALQERTAIDFLARAWEAKFTYGGDVNDIMGLLDVVKNRDGSYYIEVTATVENSSGNEFDTIVRGTVEGTDVLPRIRQSTIDTPEGGTIGYYE
jgi:hypothetical protein